MKKLLNKYLPLAYGKYYNTLALTNPEKAGEKAFMLFCTPRKGQILKSQETFLSQAKQYKTSFNGDYIQCYKWYGSGPTVLLLHGWESNSHRWRNLIGFLRAENYTIVAIDAPAHGRSSGTIFTGPLYASWVHHIMQKEAPVYLVAHSFGGIAALYHQHLYPQNSLKKIVTIGSPSNMIQLLEQYKRIVPFNKKVDQSLKAYVKKKFGFWPREFSIVHFARDFDIPGLLIHDELDPITPFENSLLVHQQWKDSKLIKTKGLGHSMHQDEVSNYIMDFLR